MSLYLLDSDGLSHVRTFCGTTDLVAWPDAMLLYQAEGVEADIMRRCGFKFYDTQIDEWHNGDDGKLLVVDNFPLKTIDAIELNGELIDSACFYVYPDKGTVYLEDGYWSEDVHNIKVTYTYGVPAIDDTIKYRVARKIAYKATCREVLLEKGSRDSCGFNSEKLEQYSLSYGKGPYALTLDQLDRDIEKAYKILGITIDVRIF